MNILSVEHLNVGYGKKQVLFDITLDLRKGDTVLIIGSNGSGKSTLLKVIYRLLDPWNKEAKIIYNNHSIKNCKPFQLIKKGMVYIPQNNELFEDFTVFENLEIAGIHIIHKKELKNRIEVVLEQLPLLKKMIKYNCSRLSGGERKLVSLAMALVTKAELLIFDEPLSGISPNNLNDILVEIQRLKNSGMSILIVEHRIKNVFNIADKVIGLKLGKVFNRELTSVEQINEVML